MNHIERYLLSNLVKEPKLYARREDPKHFNQINVDKNTEGLKVVCRKKNIRIFIKEFTTRD